MVVEHDKPADPAETAHASSACAATAEPHIDLFERRLLQESYFFRNGDSCFLTHDL
jgi:hypothetical protein